VPVEQDIALADDVERLLCLPSPGRLLRGRDHRRRLEAEGNVGEDPGGTGAFSHTFFRSHIRSPYNVSFSLYIYISLSLSLSICSYGLILDTTRSTRC
jgi:hypothetical protein